MMEQKSVMREAVFREATRVAYENAFSWSSRDLDIASQLRDGIRAAREAFDSIAVMQFDQPAELLQQMGSKVEQVLERYRTLPGNQGQWECSALNIVRQELERLVESQYMPNEEALAAAAMQLEREAAQQWGSVSWLLGDSET